MNINQITNCHREIKRIIYLTIIIFSPLVGQAQTIINFPNNGNGSCPILNSVVLDGFCFDANNLASGILTIVPVDSMIDYNYSIDGGVTIVTTGPLDSVFEPVSAGTYTIWLQEANNPQCIDSITIIIPNPQDPITTVTNVSQNLICHGDSTGGGEVNAIGGVLPYSYFWLSTGATTNITSNLPAGYHVVVVTDANGCAKKDSVLIQNIYTPFDVDLDTIQQVQCYGECNGEVVLSVTGAVGPYTFNWSTGQNYFGPGPDTLLNLCQGGHQVLISDAYGCDTVVSFIIAEPPMLYAIGSSIQPVQCFGLNDGQAFVYGTGGTGTNPSDYTYLWTPGDTISDPTLFPNLNDTVINLIPGIHTVIVTDTNGCTAADTVLITEPTQLFVDIPDSSATYSYCLPTYSGALVAQAYGGTPFPNGTYNYSWTGTAQLTDSVVNLHAGIYTVTVFDDRGCTASDVFDLDSITNTFIPDSVDYSVVHVSCYGLYDASITINSIAGSQYPIVNYFWSGPPPFISVNSSSINALYEGNYAVTIEDSKGCSMILDVDIEEPAKLEYGVAYTVNESCVGTTGSSCNGRILLDISGGTSPYFYDNLFSGVFPIPTSNQQLVVNDTLMSGFCNGIYILDITDANGCQGYVKPGASFTATVGSDVQVSIPGVFPPTPTASCFNTADAMVGVLGGANPLLNYTWESSNLGMPSGIVLADYTPYHNLLPGDYFLVAHYSDPLSFGINYVACDVSYAFTVDSGNIISSGAVITNATCYGDTDGAINLTPTGDAPSFDILWDTLTSIPVSNCTLEDQLHLAAGLYTVTITDADGCILVDTLRVKEPTPIMANLAINNVSCHNLSDGEVTVLVDPNSGQDPYDYSIDSLGILIQNNTTGFFNGLSGGDYIIIVTDSSGLGCSEDFPVTIVNPSPILASVEPSSFWGEDALGNPFHISCFGENDGSIVVGSVGGTGSVNFEWKNSLLITVSTSQEATDLIAGSYILYATDANSCQDSAVVILNEPDSISRNITTSFYDFNSDNLGTNISCFGLFDGWALSSPTGGYPGVQGYTYSWVNSNGQTVSSEAMASNLPALLSYTVTVTDMNGCSMQSTTDIFTQPLLFEANVTTTNYAGPTHAPFSVNFVDNTLSADPFSFIWTWEDGTSAFPIGTLSMDHEFTTDNIGLNQVNVVLTNTTTGCLDSVFFDIEVQGVPDINNVFTPNSDGINDEFFFDEFGMKTVSVEFYNRWGQMVYTWNGTDKSWSGVDISGEIVPEGVYFYSLVAEGEDGHYYDKKGSVTLLK